MSIKSEIVLGDCLKVLKTYSDDKFDLIMTSPPYADSRAKTYGGIHPNKYVEWFLPRAEELFRVLNSRGSFILNIKEKVVNGERHTYVINLILALKKMGWVWTEEFIWHKKSCYPGKWPNRFRDAWERCLQFNKSKKFNMYQENVMVPVGGWSVPRLKNLTDTDKIRDESESGSGFGKNVSNWIDRDMVYPTNVLHFAAETSNKNHSAAFPDELPEWFIKLFTKENDWVLDPFVGSGTTCRMAYNLRRNAVGIDTIPEHVEQAKESINTDAHDILDIIDKES